MSDPAPPTVLHYTGYNDDRGGIMSVIGALAGTGAFDCVLGVNPGFRARRFPALRTLALPSLMAEQLGVTTLWRARAVARGCRLGSRRIQPACFTATRALGWRSPCAWRRSANAGWLPPFIVSAGTVGTTGVRPASWLTGSAGSARR
jgi:hypothetical protein